VPEEVEDAVLAALAKLPADRPPSASAWALLLDGQTVRRTSRQTRGLPARPSARRSGLPWAVAIAALAVAAVAWWRVEKRPAPRPVRFAFAAENIGFSGNTLSVSADGRLIVYEGTAGGRRVLYRRGLGDLRAVPIAGTEGGFQPVLSPDDDEVAFATSDARVMRVPVEGGAPSPVANVTTPIGMAWSRDHGLVLGMPSFHRTIRGLSVLAIRGDTALRLLTRPDSGMHHDPVALRDGKTVLYVDIPFGRAGTVVGTASLEDGKSVKSELPVAGGGIAGLVDGVLVFQGRDGNLMGVRYDQSSGQAVGRPIRISENLGRVEEAELAANGTLVIRVAPGPFQVVMLDAAGTTVQTLPDTITYFRARYSPDGTRAVLVAGAVSWLYDPATGSRERLQVGSFDPREWTPDGRNLLGARSGVRQLLSVPADGSDTAVALARATNVQINRAILVPDGRTLVLGTGTGAGEFDLYTMRVGDTIATPLVATPANEVAPRLTRDGRWLAYASDESGRFEVFVRPWPGPGPRIQVSDSGGGQPVWSGDGRRLFYRSGRGMRVADLVPAGTTLTVSGRRTLFEGDYYDADNGTRSPTYDVAPDGRRFLMAKALPGSRAEILVWMDWLPEFKARLDHR
jgi:serine/threonine-protein kinase